MLTLRFEGITFTIRDEFITVRLYAVIEGRTPINCGLLVMFHADFASLCLRPPQESELVRVECIMTEGSVEEYLMRLGLGAPIQAA